MIARTQFNFAQRWQVITKPTAFTIPKQMMGWIMAGVVILCVLGAVPWVWELKLQYDTAIMNTKIAALHPVEVKIQKLNAAKAKVQSQKQLFDTIRKEDHDPTQVLDKLIPLLPMGVTIQSFSYSGDTVSVAVTASNPIDVARLWLSLHDSKTFQVTDMQSISMLDQDQSYVLALKYSDSAKLNIPAGAIVPGSLPGSSAGEGSPAGGVFTLPGQSNLGDLWLAPGGTNSGATGSNTGTGSLDSGNIGGSSGSNVAGGNSNSSSAPDSSSSPAPPAGSNPSPAPQAGSNPPSSSESSPPPAESAPPASTTPPSSPPPSTPPPESSPPPAPGNTTTVSPSLPAAPLGLTVQIIDNSKVNLHWEQISGAGSYAVYRKDSDSTDYKLLALVSGNSYSDNIILPGSYYYRVSASTDGQEGDPSLPIEVTISSMATATTKSTSILTPIPSPLNVPTGLTAQVVDGARVNLSWNSVTGADAYNVYRQDNASGDFKLLTIVSDNSFSDNIMSGSYSYKVSAAAHGQTGVQSTAVQVAISKATITNVPQRIAAVALGADQIQLNWAPVSNAGGYRVYRATDPAGPYWEITQVSVPHYTDVGLVGGISYNYRITAINMAGYNSGYSDAASAVTALPGVPTGLKATAVGNGVSLTWNLVPGATFYKVWRAPAPSDSGTYTELGTTTGTTYTDTTAVGGQSYLYQVLALSSYVQAGSPSGSVSATVLTNQN